MSTDARKTSLYELHKNAGGRIVEFADWLMPVWFDGIVSEHHTVRTKVGLFDVSHMGQVRVTGSDAAAVVDFLVTGAVSKLVPGRALYTPTLNAQGTIVDDLIVYKKAEDDFLLCVNASTKDKDVAHFLKHSPGSATIEDVSDEYSQIAVQGPKAYEVLARIWPDIAATLTPFDHIEVVHNGHRLMVAGTGYTGENGYELYVPWESGPEIWSLFMDAGADLGAAPIGLGARDTLRLEAKFCLYGNDIDETTNPLEAGLKWTIDFDSEFLGKAALRQVQEAGLTRKLVGFEMLDKGAPRQHYAIVRDGEKVGEVTSGTLSPTLGKAIGLGYIDIPHHKRRTEIEIQIRRRMAKAKVVKTPFYKAPAQ
jgi:aminomethyltransferase